MAKETENDLNALKVKNKIEDDLLRKASKTKDLTRDELRQLHEILSGDYARNVFSVITNTTDTVINALNVSDALTSEMMRIEIATMYAKYGYEDAPELERHLIDHTIACYLRLWTAEREYTTIQKKEHTLTQGMFWEKRLTMLQGRYLRAVEMLARVRRVKLPNVQINIANEGGKQLNTLQTPQTTETKK